MLATSVSRAIHRGWRHNREARINICVNFFFPPGLLTLYVATSIGIPRGKDSDDDHEHTFAGFIHSQPVSLLKKRRPEDYV